MDNRPGINKIKGFFPTFESGIMNGMKNDFDNVASTRPV